MLRHTKIVTGIDIDDVEAGALGAKGRVAVPAAQVGDIRLVHRPRLDRIASRSHYRNMGRRHGDFSAVAVGRVHAVVAELDAGQRAMGMDRVRHSGEDRDIVIVP
jgi:hypothetical protein